MNRRERRTAAKGSKTTLSTATANTPAALYQAGLQHFRAGRHLDAQICCQQALAVEAEHADTLHLMGLLSLHAEQYDHAVEWISRAIRQNPKTEYLTNLGIALRNQGRREEALKVFDKAVQLDPNDADLWRNLGNALTDAQRPADALLSFQQALKLNPRHWDAAQQCGHLLYRLGRLEEALVHFDQCNELQPDHAKTLQMRALAIYGLNQFEEASAGIRRAHALDPANADICNNSGVFLRRLGREEEALPWFDKALKLRPNFRAALVNKAFALTQIRRFVEAFAVYNEMKPGTGKTHTIRYLASNLPGHTTLIITAAQVELLAHYMSLARLLQPAMVVIEDVDLIARDREDMGPCEESMLNRLLNEMDGLKQDADILFILTTNRPEQLESALASRPGRIDQAIEVPVPDEIGREKLVQLYGKGLPLGHAVIGEAARRTKGVSAAFIKELMRRVTQASIARDGGITVETSDIGEALDDMLFAGGKLNVKLLGGAQEMAAG
jgi:tetratricopeptide (TPR) repeat protein